MTTMLGPVSTWDDNGVGHSGTLPNDWYTSPELFDLERRTLFREVWHCVGPRRPGRRAGQVFRLQVADEKSSSVRGRRRRAPRAVERLPAPRAAPWPSDAASATHSSARTTAGRSSWTAACERRRAWTAPRASSRLRHASAASSGRARGGRRSGSHSSRRCRSRVARRRHAAARELQRRRVALRRRPPLDDRLQLEALRRQLHGGIPHPLHPPGPRPEPQPERSTRTGSASTRTSSTAASRTARPGSRVAGILGGTQEFRRLKPPMPGLDQTKPRATTSTGSSR